MGMVISVIIIIILMICLVIIIDHQFYFRFIKQAQQIGIEAGQQNGNLITENDLKYLPLPVARYIRFSGFVGKKKISSARIAHSGMFKTGANNKFLPIKGEYFLTTKKPSFCWYGKVSVIPGITVSAFDSYYNGHGRMLVKVLSLFKVVDINSKETGISAFGRCIAEMNMVPSFFLDNERIKWGSSDLTKAECTITDLGLSTNAQFYFNADGSVGKIVVERYFDRGDGSSTLENFTGMMHDYKDFDGLRLASTVDGYWNLKEGDLHYVHFIIKNVVFN